MSVLIVNGVTLPTPDGGLNIAGSEGVDATRNAKFEMIAQKITDRRIVKFDSLTWSNISPEDWRKIKNEIDKFEGILKFWDNTAGAFRYIKIYWGDDKAEVLRYDSEGKITAYKKCSCNIIDMGLPFLTGF